MDRQEVWEQLVQALEDHFTSDQFEPGEFRVMHNDNMRSVAILSHGRCMSLLDVSKAHFTGGRNENDPITVHLHR